VTILAWTVRPEWFYQRNLCSLHSADQQGTEADYKYQPVVQWKVCPETFTKMNHPKSQLLWIPRNPVLYSVQSFALKINAPGLNIHSWYSRIKPTSANGTTRE
jgi:hypothetical protein